LIIDCIAPWFCVRTSRPIKATIQACVVSNFRRGGIPSGRQSWLALGGRASWLRHFDVHGIFDLRQQGMAHLLAARRWLHQQRPSASTMQVPLPATWVFVHVQRLVVASLALYQSPEF
jgi:hypothetical protein